MRFAVAALLCCAPALAGCRVRAAPPPARGWVAPSPSTEAAAAHADGVRALASGNFAARARAAEALVAAGEAALPALAAAGDLPVPALGGRATTSATRPVVEAILAALGDERLVSVALASSGANVRRAAAEELGRRGARSAVPALIDRLDDEDAGVRAAAGRALRRVAEGGRVASPAMPAGGLEDSRPWRAWWVLEGAEEPSAVRPP